VIGRGSQGAGRGVHQLAVGVRVGVEVEAVREPPSSTRSLTGGWLGRRDGLAGFRHQSSAYWWYRAYGRPKIRV
jgi:hypothetical protein